MYWEVPRSLLRRSPDAGAAFDVVATSALLARVEDEAAAEESSLGRGGGLNTAFEAGFNSIGVIGLAGTAQVDVTSFTSIGLAGTA